MARLGSKRLLAEYREMVRNPPVGITAGPIHEETSLYEWEALIVGPEGTCFENGCFHAKLSFPADYPLNPPKMVFTTPIWHPNIYEDGKVCISILHAPGEDAFGYEKSEERWSPVQSIEKILISVMSMLSAPNDESPANIDAAKMWREDRQAYEEKVRVCVAQSLGFKGNNNAEEESA